VDSDLSPASSETHSPLDKNNQLVELSKMYILAKNRELELEEDLLRDRPANNQAIDLNVEH